MMNVVESVVVIVLVCVGRCDLALANSSRSPKPFHNYGAWPPGLAYTGVFAVLYKVLLLT